MLLDEHCEAITADLSRYHHRRITDLFTGDLTYLEVGWLLQHLPPESAYRTWQRNQYSDVELAGMDEPENHGPWSLEATLLASVIDQIAVLTNVQLARAGVQTEPVKQVRRPGVAGSGPREISPQAQAYLANIRARHAEQRTGKEETQ